MSRKYFIISEQSNEAQDELATFAARGFVLGWLISENKYIFGHGEESFVLSDKARRLGY